MRDESNLKYIDKDNHDLNASSFILEYKGHKCQGYNIGASFFNSEEHIITGSEDSYVYFYNKLSGNIDHKLQT